jgi:hypothetical protein
MSDETNSQNLLDGIEKSKMCPMKYTINPDQKKSFLKNMK